MSGRSSAEELVEFIRNKDDENIKKSLKAILKRKIKERVLEELEDR